MLAQSASESARGRMEAASGHVMFCIMITTPTPKNQQDPNATAGTEQIIAVWSWHGVHARATSWDIVIWERGIHLRATRVFVRTPFPVSY